MHAALTRFDPRSGFAGSTPTRGRVPARPSCGAWPPPALRRRAQRRPRRRHRRARVRTPTHGAAGRSAPRDADPQERGRRSRSMPTRSRGRPAWPWTAAGWARAWPPTSSPTGCAACPLRDRVPGRRPRRRRRASAADRRPVERRGADRADADRRRGGHQRRHAPRMAPDRPRHRAPRPHRHRPGDRARAHRARGRGPRQGGPAGRPRAARHDLPHGGLFVLADGEDVSL